LDFIVGFDIYIENSTGEERRIRKENITKLHTVIKNAQQGKFSNNNCEMFRDSKSFSKMLANTKQLIEGKAVD
jgi:hypothetical protein